MKKTCSGCGKVKSMFSWENKCFACGKKEYRQKIKDDIANGEITETNCETEIYCPWCGEAFDPSDFDGEMYEEGGHEITCSECEKDFVADVRVSYYYDTKRT